MLVAVAYVVSAFLVITSSLDSACQSYNCSPDAVIRVHDSAGNAIEMHKHTGDFKD